LAKIYNNMLELFTKLHKELTQHISRKP
jgi:hypothetical protein